MSLQRTPDAPPSRPAAAGRPGETVPAPGAGGRPGESRSRARLLLLGGAGLLALAGLIAGRQELAAQTLRLAEGVQGLGAWAPLAFVVAYTLATVAFVPGFMLTMAAGVLFGLAEGTAVVFAGAVLGSTAAFVIARYAARDAVERRLAGDARFAAVDRAIAREGRRIVLLLRLSPAFPFNLLNYALGLTRVGLRDYCVASLGMLPGTLLYVYYGKVAGDLAVLAGGAAAERGLAYYAYLGVGLAATVVVTTIVTRTARRALREATQS